MEQNNGISIWYFFAFALLGMFFSIALVLGSAGLLYEIGVLVIGALLGLATRMANRAAFARKVPFTDKRDLGLFAFIALCVPGTTLVSVLDMKVWHIATIPAFLTILGIALLVSAYFVFFQSATANPRHAGEKYGEAEPDEPHRGPYDVIRHPFMLGLILLLLAIPLLFATGLGYAVSVPGIIAVIARTAMEDDRRYQEYPWYIDYVKSVGYRLIPFVW